METSLKVCTCEYKPKAEEITKGVLVNTYIRIYMLSLTALFISLGMSMWCLLGLLRIAKEDFMVEKLLLII